MDDDGSFFWENFGASLVQNPITEVLDRASFTLEDVLDHSSLIDETKVQKDELMK